MSDSRSMRLWKAVRRLTGFWGNRSGNIAMMFGIAAIPFFAFGGLAVDFSRAMMVKNRLAAALDATALAVGGQAGLTEAQLTASANAYFRANYSDSEIGRPSALRLTFADREVTVAADATVDTVIMGLIGFHEMTVSAEAEVVRSSNSLEIAMVLDVTGSMAGSKIADLRAAAADLVNIVVWDDQSEFTSRVSLVPYDNAVNPGATVAANVRGAIPAGKTITGASWFTTSKTITSAPTKANPIVITISNHGFANNDTVYISGVNGMTQLNNKVYTVYNVSGTNKFSLKLNGTAVNSTSYNTWTSGGTIRKCTVSDCGMVITSNGHGFANGDKIRITGIASSMSPTLNQTGDAVYTVANSAVNTFSLLGAVGANYGTWSSGGSAFCTTNGCRYFNFTAADGSSQVYEITNCVTERTGANKYTDVAPTAVANRLGKQYTNAAGGCLTNTVVPMTADKTLLTDRINALRDGGTTAGHIGIAWGWYTLAPDFGYLWPDSQPEAYDADELIKIAVLMTDGEFNTAYCNGVLSNDSTGNNVDQINCNAQNGTPFAQAAALCTAMKDKGIIVYTVGFALGSDPAARTVMTNCATDAAHAYNADNGTQLRAAFRAIAVDISSLRLSH